MQPPSIHNKASYIKGNSSSEKSVHPGAHQEEVKIAPTFPSLPFPPHSLTKKKHESCPVAHIKIFFVLDATVYNWKDVNKRNSSITLKLIE